VTALEYVNALVWPGNLGALLACTARIIVKPEHLTDEILRHAADTHRADDGWETAPWLEIAIRLDRRHQSFPHRQISFAVPASSALEPLAASVHKVALYVLESEMLETARLSGQDGIQGRVWRTGIFAPMRELPGDAAWQAPT
jgi:hypothetical protein